MYDNELGKQYTKITISVWKKLILQRCVAIQFFSRNILSHVHFARRQNFRMLYDRSVCSANDGEGVYGFNNNKVSKLYSLQLKPS